jgi:transposase InsO family protein
VIRVLEQLIEMHGKPRALRVDNGTEFTSIAFTEWCEERKIELYFIEPGKPDQNAFIERFKRTYPEEVLDAHLSTRSSRYVTSPSPGSRNTTRSGHMTALGVRRP